MFKQSRTINLLKYIYLKKRIYDFNKKVIFLNYVVLAALNRSIKFKIPLLNSHAR